MLSKQLEKIGLSEGKSTLELKSDKTYNFTMGKKTYSGTYTYDAASSKLVLQGSLGLSTLNCTATVKGNELYMLFEADKLLTFATGIAGTSRNIGIFKAMKLCADYEKMSAEEKQNVQNKRLEDIVKHARESSPYYKELYQNVPEDFELTDLPPVDKKGLMSNWNG